MTLEALVGTTPELWLDIAIVFLAIVILFGAANWAFPDRDRVERQAQRRAVKVRAEIARRRMADAAERGEKQYYDSVIHISERRQG